MEQHNIFTWVLLYLLYVCTCVHVCVHVYLCMCMQVCVIMCAHGRTLGLFIYCSLHYLFIWHV